MYSTLAYQKLNMMPFHYTNRRQRVNAVVIHYTAAVVREAQAVVDYWARNDDDPNSDDKYTSSNYIIDVSGRISAVIRESLRAFTTGTWNRGEDDIDDRAITIEVSTDTPDSDHVSGNSIDALTKLLADIGERYGIYWKFTGDKTGNVHAHRWYQNTPCPGDYLFRKFDIIVDIANFMIYKKEEMKTQEINDRLDALESHTLPAYHCIEDVPSYWRKEVKWCMDNGYLQGEPDGDLNLSYDELRSLVVAARMAMQ